MKIILSSAFFFLLFINVQPISAQEKIDSSAIKMDALFQKYDHKTRPGCAVAIIKDGHVIFKKGYGMANLEYGIPITTASIFDIASLSKQFTGLCISMLIQQGKISTDDDIHQYLPDVPDFGKAITIRHLLHHTSGLRDWPEALAAGGWDYEEEASFEDIMHMVRHQKELDFEPGSTYSYSNTGYNMLAAIIHKVSGKSFKQFTDSAIFKPLGMPNTHFLDDKENIVPNLAYSYSYDKGHFSKVQNVLTAYGSSSLYTSVDDLCKWVINFQQALAAKDPLYIRMLTQDKLNNGKNVDYAFGVSISSDRGLKTIAHTGGWAAYRTIIMNYPDEKLSIIGLASADDIDITGTLVHQMADIYLAGKFKYEKKQVDNRPAVNVDTALLRKYTGTYKYGPGEVSITLENGQIIFQYTGERKFPTIATSDSTFYLAVAEQSLTFFKDAEGVINSFKFKNITGKRFIRYNPTITELNIYNGTYYSEELAAEYKVYVKDGKLMISHFRRGEFPLVYNIKYEFSSDIGTIRFFSDDQGKIMGYKLSGGRVRNLRFDKK